MTGATKPRRERIDVLLAQRNLAASRARAQAMVMAGEVFVAGERVDKPGTAVPIEAPIEVRSSRPTYVSRGGDKLQGALQSFAPAGLDVTGKVAADFGSSTGGFVDCLLQHGAARVHAIDVGQNLLHEKLRADARVVVHEQTNARDLTADSLGEPVDLVVVDASFIGLSKLLQAVGRVLRPEGELVALIKPQFEAGRREVARGRGVIRDEQVRARVIAEVIEQVAQAGFVPLADAPCVIRGPKGNQEHFVYARRST